MPSLVSDFHEGERAVQSRMKAPRLGGDPTNPGLSAAHGMRVMQSPLVAVGTLDSQGHPWTTVWGGERGFARPVAQGILGLNASVDTRHDPVFEAFWAGADPDDEGGVVRPESLMSALSIDLETRDRVKLAGRMVGGAKTPDGVQMAMHVTESLGNCPKYLNKRVITPHEMRPELVADKLPLSEEAVRLIGRADMFFMSTTNGETMDTNHRGGAPGFVRVMENDENGVVLAYPEYSGNRLYQSLGNLNVNPLIGIVFPDYETSDALYMTGSASILYGDEATSLLPRTNLALKITITAARLVKSGLPFHGRLVDYSPYNPPLRLLHTEHDSHLAAQPAKPDLAATLVAREKLTPTVARFTLRLAAGRDAVPTWFAGQYVTLDFHDELATGYAHMNDADPQSLNDDYVRTFTVSSAPGDGSDARELQITLRKHGPATGLLWRHHIAVPLELPVLGFGGEEAFRMPTFSSSSSSDDDAGQPVFVAAGMGVTPLLAQARGVLAGGAQLRVLWSLRGEDLALATDSFGRIPGLASVTTLFVTGDGGAAGEDMLREVEAMGARVERRRMAAGDVEVLKGRKRKFFLCTAPALLKSLGGWLGGEEVVSEDFGY